MSEAIKLLGPGPPHKRRQRSVDGPRQSPNTLPQERRELLARWIRRGGNSRWETLAKDAGNAYPSATGLLEWLLQGGWAMVTEVHRGQAWWPAQVEIRELAALRAALDLPDPDAARAAWEAARHTRFGHPALDAAADSLADLPAARALARLELLARLHLWHEARRRGTRRDFAWFARGDTKAVSEAEWDWLAAACDLETLGISGHTPHLLVAAPVVLFFAHSGIDLAASPDWFALTPATVSQVLRSEGLPRVWRLIENRTSFERCARARAQDEGVIWLPGYPPRWWRDAVGRLIVHAPACAEIACDPDPAGIEIACQAGALWEAARLPWQPHAMAAQDLERLRLRKPLTKHDHDQLATLLNQPLPTSLRHLAETLSALGEKGEQEGYL